MKKRRMRQEKQIVDDWTKILSILEMFGCLSTRTIAERLKRNPDTVLHDLQQMKKKGLVFSSREGNHLVWSVGISEQPAQQYSFLTDVAVTLVPRHPKIASWPELKREVVDARPARDLRQEKWIIGAKKRFAKTIEAAGGRISWQEADSHLAEYRRGNPQAIISMLQEGRGATVTWSCGCRMTFPWDQRVDEALWEFCPPDGVCQRTIFQEQAMEKVIAHQAPVQVFDQQTAHCYETPLQMAVCWRVAKVPAGLIIGQTFTQYCGCQFVVSQVDDCLMGVIYHDRGKACPQHMEEIAVSQW